MGIKTDRFARKVIVIASVIGIAMATGRVAFAANNCSNPVAQVVSIQGAVTLDQSSAHLDDEICPGVVIEVAANSRAAILLLGQNTILRIDQNTQYVVQSASEESPTIELFKGIIHFFSKIPESLWIKTPFVNAEVKGTEFVVQVGENQSDVLVVEGRVRVSNENGEVLLAANEAASAQKGQAPQRRQIVSPLNSVQWALYYPPLELSEKASIPTREAADLLAVGRVKEAEKILNDIRKTAPNDAVIPALLAMIAVGQNRNEEAIVLADEAVELNPNSSIAYTSLSYAQQSRFDIDAALLSAQQAVEKDSNNAYAWARLAELQSSKGDLKASLQSAQNAVEVDPNLSRAQTVLGFTHLTRIEIEEATVAFNNAINLDNSDPLARLGLGLAKIRKNHLAEGREQIEIAASLDPNNSLIRSYLGKAYFEERRNDLAVVQFDLAKELDPNDPTPWYYDAIRKQTENQPVSAREALQTSVRLNDNRSTYRSRLLLDQDQAARGVSLARIYDDLGFQQQGVLESTKSLAVDPSNHSAHQFLSDSYADLPRHEIARVSELLQAQMLQPVNTAPVKPQSAITDLNIVTNSGLTASSFNEYAPLLERNATRINTSGVLGNNNTWGDEAVISGLHDRFSYSVGQFHYETDGYRINNNLEHDIYNVFGQFAATPDLNFQFEHRQRETTHGDLGFNFDRNEFEPERNDDLEDSINRVGINYRISPESSLLFSVIDTERTRMEAQPIPDLSAPFVLQIDSQEEGIQFDGQYIVKQGDMNHTIGMLNYSFDVQDILRADFAPFPCLFQEGCLLIDSRERVEQNTLYSYSNINLPENFIWTLGASYDAYNDDQHNIDLNQFNPKLGLRWRPSDQFQFRIAYIETLKRRLLANQTLEPTYVAGFNQLYDDLNGSNSQMVGVGAEYNYLNHWTLGFESVKREITARLLTPSDTGALSSIEKLDELTNKVYFLWSLNKKLALHGEYLLDSYKNHEKELIGKPIDLDTTKLLVGIKYFTPSGFFAELSVSNVDQDVTNRLMVIGPNGFPAAGPELVKSDNFNIVDGAIGYRFKNRQGSVSLQFNNLLDEKFNYQSDNFRSTVTRSPSFIPDASVVMQAQYIF